LEKTIKKDVQLNMSEMGEETFDDQNIQLKETSRLALLNIAEERKKSYTKPTIIRLEYKTRYDSSKKVFIY
jgi:hypothetical protein